MDIQIFVAFWKKKSAVVLDCINFLGYFLNPNMVSREVVWCTSRLLGKSQEAVELHLEVYILSLSNSTPSTFFHSMNYTNSWWSPESLKIAMAMGVFSVVQTMRQCILHKRSFGQNRETFVREKISSRRRSNSHKWEVWELQQQRERERERESQKDFFKNVLLFDIYLSKKTDHHITILTNIIPTYI